MHLCFSEKGVSCGVVAFDVLFSVHANRASFIYFGLFLFDGGSLADGWRYWMVCGFV